MQTKSVAIPNQNTKLFLHPKNKHRKEYDYSILVKVKPELNNFIIKNKSGNPTIDYSNPSSVKLLNAALLKYHYKINHWDIPPGYLCPPIPGRADYIHYISELFIVKKKITVIDVGTGSNCIYPLIGTREYDWNFIASETDQTALENAQKIVEDNRLEDKISVRSQNDKNEFFFGILKREEFADISICNPPFFSSEQEAIKANLRKNKNLNLGSKKEYHKNFEGQNNEIWCKGGERLFIKKMIKESASFQHQIKYFSALISNKDNLKTLLQTIHNVKAKHLKTIKMRQGQKQSRILVWTFD